MTSNGSSSASSVNPDVATHLSLVRKLIVSQFSDALAAAGAVTADSLYNRASTIRDDREQKFLMAASALLRNRSTELASQAATALAKRFDQKLNSEDTGIHSKTTTYSMGSLSLQDDDEVQENIALNDTTARVKETASFELLSLTTRIQSLTGRATLPDSDNPVFPKVFCRALLDALELIDAKGSAKLAIFSGFQPALEKMLPKIYAAINKALINEGVMPDIVETYGKPVSRDSWQTPRGDASAGDGNGNGAGGNSFGGGATRHGSASRGADGSGSATANDIDRSPKGSFRGTQQYSDSSSSGTGESSAAREHAGRQQPAGNRDPNNGGGGRYVARGSRRPAEPNSPGATNEQAASSEIVGLLNQLVSQQPPAAPESEAQSADAGFAALNAQLAVDLGTTGISSASPAVAASASPADQGDRIFIGSIAFVDIVGFSKLSVSEQSDQKDRFNALLTEASREISTDQRLILDTGDGAALSFLGDPEDALFVCMKMRTLMRQDNAGIKSGVHKLELCQGINLGPVKMTRDINGQPNILGDGINVAQRIMSFAGPDQVAVSRSYFDVVSVIGDEYAPLFASAGVRADKHLREHEIYMVGESATAFDLIQSRVTKRYPNVIKVGAVSGRHSALTATAVNTALLEALNRLQLSLGTGSATSPGGTGRERAPQGEGENFPALLPDFTGSTVHSPSPVTQDPAAGNVLHKVQALLSPQMTPADVAATDLLAAIFDGIFDDAALPVSVKALLGRLQIPALKVAVRDPEFFNSASHPLRLLIERIATLGKEQGTTLTDNDAFYKLLAQTVQFVQAENATEAGVLEGALIRLNTSVILELW